MKGPEGMEILSVLPYNYDRIIELSESSRKEGAYSREDLERMRIQAQANNSVALVMFMSPSYWLGGGKDVSADQVPPTDP